MCMKMVLKVTIIGAGVNVLSCAVVIQEKFSEADLTIFAEKFSPETTSDGAAGLLIPFSHADASTLHEYSKLTQKYLKKPWKSPIAGKVGVSLVPCLEISNETLPVPAMSDIVYGFQPIDIKELSSFNKPEWKSGFRFLTSIIEVSKLLPYYFDKFKLNNLNNNGTAVTRRLDSLSEIASVLDVVINCLFLLAYHLENDQLVHPICNRVIRVKVPWTKAVLLDESDYGCYIIPNHDSIVLRGTHHKDQWHTSPCSNDTKFILDGCFSTCLSLKNAELIDEWVGLCPGRQRILG